MELYFQPTIQCPIGDETLAAMHSCGAGALALGLVTLAANGVKPRQPFSSKQLNACGLEKNLVDKILRQCEGNGFDKRKTNKLERKKQSTEYEIHEKEELESLIEFLIEDRDYEALRLIFQGMSSDEVPEKYREVYLHFSQKEELKIKPPEPSAVNQFFSVMKYDNPELPPLDFSELPTRGRPGRIFVFPESLDELAKRFGVQTPDSQQHHFEFFGEKTVRSFFDALYLQWHYRNRKELGRDKENRHSVAELCSVVGDSPNAVRARNKRVSIEAKPNFKEMKVNAFVANALTIKGRGDIRFVLDLPEWKLPEGVTYGQRLRYLPQFSRSKTGLATAKKEWEAAGSPKTFHECLRATYRTISTYEFVEPSKKELS